MKRVINAAVCDARGVTEETLSFYENTTVNSAVLITSPHAREIMGRYPFTVNVNKMIDVPEDRDIVFKSVNGKAEIGPDSDGTDVYLLVNGKLTVADGSADAVESYYGISVNGKAVMPKSYQGRFSNFSVNGKTEYYPDGAAIMKADSQIDDLYIARAAGRLYYCPGNLFILDIALDTQRLKEKGIRLAAKKIIIAECLVSELIPVIDEETEIVRVPDGTRLIDDDTEITERTVRKYGSRLCVNGDVSIKDPDALSSLEYLFANGTVSVNKELEEAFEQIEYVADEIRIVDPEQGYITDRPAVRIGASVMERYPNGVRVEDCAKVILSEELTPQDIMEKLIIEDCAVVVCSDEQEEAVNMIAEDVAVIRTSGRDNEDNNEKRHFGGMLKEVLGTLGELKDTQVINSVEYKL